MTDRHGDYVEVFISPSDGEYRWRRRAANHQIISVSGEGYVDHDYCLAIAADLNPGCRIEDET